MADAISTLSLSDGALQGWGVADNYYNTQHQKRRVDALDAENKRRYEEGKAFREQQAADSNAFRERQLQLSEQNSESLNSMREQQMENSKWVQAYKQRIADQELLAQQFPVEFEKAKRGIAPSQSYMDGVKKYGLTQLDPFALVSPEFQDKAKKAEILLQRIQAGDLEYANSPEGLAIANDVLGDQINIGVGEFTAPAGIGKKITGKEIAAWETYTDPKTKQVSVTPKLKVSYHDGTYENKPWSIGRSSEEDDPVQLIPPEKLVDRLKSTVILANYVKSNPEVALSIQNLGSLHSQQSAKGTQSATGKTIADLVHWGVSQGEAIKLATMAKTDPTGAIASLTNTILKNQSMGAEEPLTPAQAAVQARQIIMSIKSQESAPLSGRPSAQTGASGDYSQLETLVAKAMQGPKNAGKEDQVRAAIASLLSTSGGANPISKPVRSTKSSTPPANASAPEPTRPPAPTQDQSVDTSKWASPPKSLSDSLLPQGVQDFVGSTVDAISNAEIVQRPQIAQQFHDKYGRYPTEQEIQSILSASKNVVAQN